MNLPGDGLNLLLDEDSQGRSVVRLLREAGHNVLTVGEAGLRSRSDSQVLEFAIQKDRVLLTRNVRDFELLHHSVAIHPGILVEHQDRDPAKNMRDADIVNAITNIERSGWNPVGEFISLNAWSFIIEIQE